MGTAAQVYVETPGVLPAGLYELEELAAPEGYVLQGHEGVITKKDGASGNGTFYETEKTGKWTDTPQGRHPVFRCPRTKRGTTGKSARL